MSGTEEVKMIEMGKCVDCNADWFMTLDEHANFQRLVDEKHYTWPKRCKPCRAKKRVQSSRKPNLRDVHTKLKQMSEDAINEMYFEDPDRLAQELTDLANQVLYILNNRREQ